MTWYARGDPVPFVKLWDNILDNIKVQRLEPETFRAWVNLLAVTVRYGGRYVTRDSNGNAVDEEDDKGGGELPSWEDMAFGLRTSKAAVKGHIDALVTAGLIDKTKRHYSIHDFEKWNDSRDATAAKRQKEWRARNALRNAQRNGVSTPLYNALEGNEGYEGENKEAAVIRAREPVCAREGPPPPTAAASFRPLRGEEDDADWREALNVIRERGESAHIADEIEASRDPRVTGMDGWRALVAAHALKKPGKAQTLAFFVRAGEKANTADLEVIEGKPGKPKPKPKPKPKAKRAVKAEPAEEPIDPEQIRAEIAELEAMPHRRDWDETRLKLAKETLASIGGMNGELP
jgi:hypothetical protein